MLQRIAAQRTGSSRLAGSGHASQQREATGAVKRTLADYAQRLDVIPALRAQLLPTVAQRAAQANKGSRGCCML